MPKKTNIKLDSYQELVEQWHSINSKNPSDFSQYSNKKVWWKCSEGPDHEWEATIASRTKDGSGCPFCRGFKISEDNNLLNKYPEIASEWDYQKNNEIPENIYYGSNNFVWWLCKNNHSYKSRVVERTNKNYGCSVCSNSNKGYGKASIDYEWINQYPLNEQWDYCKNKSLGEPNKFNQSSTKKVWWKCSEGPDHEWEAEIRKRAIYKTGCPFCKGKKLSITNRLDMNFPDVISEWDFNKNLKSPDNYFQYSSKKVWWKCSEGPDHEWEAKISSRTLKKTGCPFCSGHNASETNMLRKIYPDIFKEIDNEFNDTSSITNITTGSNKEFYFKCKITTHPPWKTRVTERLRQQIGCSYCILTPRSLEEIYLMFELKLFFNIDEYFHKINIRNHVYDLDIIIQKYNIIIEYDGWYWHKTNEKKDFTKSKALAEQNYRVIRLREDPLDLIDGVECLKVYGLNYKNTANKVLNHLSDFIEDKTALDKYIAKKSLQNKIKADNYIETYLKNREDQKVGNSE